MLQSHASQVLLARLRVALAVSLAATLAACSGGGGGGPATPTLTLTPSSTTAAPGGAAITLHAAVTGSGATPAWTLVGPGSLDTASGTDAVYTPPAATPGNEAATATITAAVGGVSRQAQVALAETAGPGHHWNIGLAAGVTWTDVAWGGGRFVAVGFDDVATSIDGRHWTHVNTERVSWRSAAYGAGVGWVVVGGDDRFLTSPDGVTWTAQPSVQGRPAPARVVFGNGMFVGARPGGSMVSSDGLAWTTTTAKLYDVAFGNGVFVGEALGGPVATADGHVWPASAAAGSLPQANDGVAFGNGVFVATTGLAMSTSADGSHWTAVAAPPFSGGRPLFAIDRFFTQYGSTSSADGRTWDTSSALRSGLGAANADATVVVVSVFDAGTTPTNIALASGPTIAAATPVLPGSLGTFNGIDCGAAGCLAVMPDYAFLSTGPSAWTGHELRSDAGSLWANALLHVDPFGTFAVGGLRGNTVAIMTSADGLAWMEAATPVHRTNGGNGVLLTAAPQGLLAITVTSAVMASPDGGTWTDVANVPLGAVTAVVRGSDRYVALGAGGGSATSTDGVTWQVGTAVSDGVGEVAFFGLVHDGTQFVAVGQRGGVATSPDGLTWTLRQSATTAWLYAVARASNGELVAVGDQGVVQTSGDGVHWTLRASGTSRLLRAVAATPSGFYAAGEDNVILYSSN